MVPSCHLVFVSSVNLQIKWEFYFAGAGSTPLHYAACGGNLKCCQVIYFYLLWFWKACFCCWRLIEFCPNRFFLQEALVAWLWTAMGRFFLDGPFQVPIPIMCSLLIDFSACRWLPLDVAKMWGRHWLEPILAPHSESIIPVFPASSYLSLPLMSVLNIGR